MPALPSAYEGVNDLPRLLIFRVSHYSEKARWALDHKRIPYQLEALLPGLHSKRVRAVAKGSCVPVLLHRERVVQGSAEILSYLEQEFEGPALLPADASAAREALDWQKLLDSELGEPARRVAYHYALTSPSFTIPLYAQGGPWWAAPLYRLSFSRVVKVVRKMYDITEANVALDLQRLRQVFQRVDARLAQQPRLAGQTFSLADLTLASLAAPLIFPSGHPTLWPSRELLPPELQELIREFRDTATADYVMDLYRQRAPSAAVV